MAIASGKSFLGSKIGSNFKSHKALTFQQLRNKTPNNYKIVSLHEIFHHINTQGVLGLNIGIARSDSRGNTEPQMSYRYCAICSEIVYQINIQGVSGLKVSIAGSYSRSNADTFLKILGGLQRSLIC